MRERVRERASERSGIGVKKRDGVSFVHFFSRLLFSSSTLFRSISISLTRLNSSLLLSSNFFSSLSSASSLLLSLQLYNSPSRSISILSPSPSPSSTVSRSSSSDNICFISSSPLLFSTSLIIPQPSLVLRCIKIKNNF